MKDWTDPFVFIRTAFGGWGQAKSVAFGNPLFFYGGIYGGIGCYQT